MITLKPSVNNILFLLSLVLTSLPTIASTEWQNHSSTASATNTHKYTLSNGLHLLVREDKRAPMIVFQVWYKVGSSYEPVNKTGISHALEHMMFRGTSALKPGETSKWIARFGGQENAFTSYDATAYYQIWASAYLELSFAIEADRMKNLALSETEFAKELQVVKEERRQRTEDNPNNKAFERFTYHALPGNPYHSPIIGWMHDLDQLTLHDAQHWYDLWYHPNNSIIVVAGDVDPENARQLAEKYFQDIPAKNLPKRSPPKTIPSLGKRAIQTVIPAKVPAVYMGFNVPTLGSDPLTDPYIPYKIYLLSALLDGGYSSRLEKTLVRKAQLASSTSARYYPFSRGDNLLMITATPSQGTDFDTLQTGIWEILEQLKTAPPPREELDKVKAQLFAQLIYQQDNLSNQANQIGRLESLGFGWKTGLEMIDVIKTITPNDIQDTAKIYFTNAKLTVSELIPQEK